MIVFLRRVPPDVSREEILEFLDPAVKGGLFRRAGEVVSVSLLQIKTFKSLEPEYHAIAHIRPDEVGERVIKMLHGQMFRGKRLALHEYAVRDWRNDRRVSPSPPGSVPVERRRLATRRRVVTVEVIPLE